MKKLSTITIALAISGISLAQKQSNYQTLDKAVFEDNSMKQLYVQFLKKQNLPLSNANTEVFVIENKTWSRPFGETNYCLTPTMDDVQQYENRIASQNDKTQNVYKSNFHFVNVEVTKASKNMLAQVNIIVPQYVKNQAIVYLPQIDIEYLVSNQVNVEVLSNYGNKLQPSTKGSDSVGISKALIWSEDFEANTVPGANYGIVNGSVNCGWKDVSCYKHNGSWSVWCAGNGAACNACGNDYVNNMTTYFANTVSVNVTGYNNIFFKYWIDLDLNNTGTNDEFRRYDNLGTGSWTLQFTATSAHVWDGTLWNQGSVSYTGQTFTQYQFQFGFSSNGFGTSSGVYLDDLQITGTPTSTVGVQELEQQNNLLAIYPNPSKGIFSLVVEQNVLKIEITDLNGKVVSSISNITQSQMEINLSAQSKGIYFVKAISDNSVSTKKVIIE